MIFKIIFRCTDVISIDASIAAAFNLPTYSEVIMRIIDPTTVALDSVEITFKDQYMGRSEMWRLKTYLVIIKNFKRLRKYLSLFLIHCPF